jgi:hypothetical protein
LCGFSHVFCYDVLRRRRRSVFDILAPVLNVSRSQIFGATQKYGFDFPEKSAQKPPIPYPSTSQEVLLLKTGPIASAKRVSRPQRHPVVMSESPRGYCMRERRYVVFYIDGGTRQKYKTGIVGVFLSGNLTLFPLVSVFLSRWSEMCVSPRSNSKSYKTLMSVR